MPSWLTIYKQPAMHDKLLESDVQRRTFFLLGPDFLMALVFLTGVALALLTGVALAFLTGVALAFLTGVALAFLTWVAVGASAVVALRTRGSAALWSWKVGLALVARGAYYSRLISPWN